MDVDQRDENSPKILLSQTVPLINLAFQGNQFGKKDLPKTEKYEKLETT